MRQLYARVMFVKCKKYTSLTRRQSSLVSRKIKLMKFLIRYLIRKSNFMSQITAINMFIANSWKMNSTVITYYL